MRRFCARIYAKWPELLASVRLFIYLLFIYHEFMSMVWCGFQRKFRILPVASQIESIQLNKTFVKNERQSMEQEKLIDAFQSNLSPFYLHKHGKVIGRSLTYFVCRAPTCTVFIDLNLFVQIF